MMKRALNHMAAPTLGWASFLKLAEDLGCVGVEFRNDLGRELFEGAAPEDVGAAVQAKGLRILALAEVKAFQEWSDSKRDQAESLMQIAKACGAQMVSLIARNDGKRMNRAERNADLRTAMRELLPLLKAYGLKGLIEPLGFESCPLRDKGEAVEAIADLGASDHFRIVHDTFHHSLAGGGPTYPDHTGMIHVSGVVDPSLSIAGMRDEHRVLVDERDRLGNVSQVVGLLAAGYSGPISFEPFAPDVLELRDPLPALARSFEYIESELSGANTDGA